MTPRPQFEAPSYRAPGKREGEVALITGGDSGVDRALAHLYARKSAHLAIVFLPADPTPHETSKEVPSWLPSPTSSFTA